eukprot:scaffold267640_cov35-Tisochrysis_lutea.AAC.1
MPVLPRRLARWRAAPVRKPRMSSQQQRARRESPRHSPRYGTLSEYSCYHILNPTVVLRDLASPATESARPARRDQVAFRRICEYGRVGGNCC